MVVLTVANGHSRYATATDSIRLLQTPRFDFVVASQLIDNLLNRKLLIEKDRNYYKSDEGKIELRRSYNELSVVLLSIYSEVTKN